MYVSLNHTNNQYNTKLVYNVFGLDSFGQFWIVWFGAFVLELGLLIVRVIINSGLIDRVTFNQGMYHFCGFVQRKSQGLSVLSENGGK
jgi:hypothetical protein